MTGNRTHNASCFLFLPRLALLDNRQSFVYQTHSFGVVVPDPPGCFSTGDTIDDGGTIPAPGQLSGLVNNPEFSGWLLAVVEIDSVLLANQSERVNIKSTAPGAIA